MARSLTGLVETLKDCSPNLQYHVLLSQISRKTTSLGSYARTIAFYQRLEKSDRTNQIRRFPTEHGRVSPNTWENVSCEFRLGLAFPALRIVVREWSLVIKAPLSPELMRIRVCLKNVTVVWEC